MSDSIEIAKIKFPRRKLSYSEKIALLYLIRGGEVGMIDAILASACLSCSVIPYTLKGQGEGAFGGDIEKYLDASVDFLVNTFKVSPSEIHAAGIPLLGELTQSLAISRESAKEADDFLEPPSGAGSSSG